MTLAEVLRNEGLEEGRKEGETEALTKMAVRLLTKKFGIMPADYREKITQLDPTTLEILIEEITDFKDLDAVKKYF